jgi:acetyl-CoA carboxylase carboxyl transferase subunit alpha
MSEPSALSDRQVLEFERPIIELERKIAELRGLSTPTVDFSAEIRKLEQKAKKLQKEIFAELSAQQKVQLSRHPARPYTLDYVRLLTEDFVELHGDRSFHDDPSIVGGMARFDAWEVLVLGNQKGKNTKENLHRNFGMARPEGYRKATRLMRMASRFRRPILCFIDTPRRLSRPGRRGARPGRGDRQGPAGDGLVVVPVISVVIGEGGSGGALALGVADRILMLEYSIYSVISPEGCASILWRDPAKVPEAASQLRLTAPDLVELGICDEVIPEAPGGAHRDAAVTAARIRVALKRHLRELTALSPDELVEQRYQKFRAMGKFLDPVA